MEKFDGLVDVEERIGKEAMLMVLEILGGDAGRVRYVPSPQAWQKYQAKAKRRQEIRARFEVVLREEARAGAGFTLRAYQAVAVEVGLSARQVMRIVAGR